LRLNRRRLGRESDGSDGAGDAPADGEAGVATAAGEAVAAELGRGWERTTGVSGEEWPSGVDGRSAAFVPARFGTSGGLIFFATV
jgi:hypothetical protein